MNIGTYQGDNAEIDFVKTFNKNKNLFNSYLSKFKDKNNLWMIRVTTRQPSALCSQRVFTRADCYLGYFDSNIISILNNNDFYLSEEILEKNCIFFRKINNSGISIKMTTSNKFQILKTGPKSFYALFNTYELGAGASLYCKKEEELVKNPDVILGWNSTIKKMTSYFSTFTKNDTAFYLNKEVCDAIKKYSNLEIKRLIDNSVELQKKIFNGIGLYEEPYTAHYFYHGKKLDILTTIPFSVTTGSGRSHGDYTIVLKP